MMDEYQFLTDSTKESEINNFFKEQFNLCLCLCRRVAAIVVSRRLFILSSVLFSLVPLSITFAQNTSNNAGV